MQTRSSPGDGLTGFQRGEQTWPRHPIPALGKPEALSVLARQLFRVARRYVDLAEPQAGVRHFQPSRYRMARSQRRYAAGHADRLPGNLGSGWRREKYDELREFLLGYHA